jgi:hypothetical protein
VGRALSARGGGSTDDLSDTSTGSIKKEVGTIRRPRDSTVRQGRCIASTRDVRQRAFSTEHDHAARPGTPAQSADTRVTRRIWTPLASVVVQKTMVGVTAVVSSARR